MSHPAPEPFTSVAGIVVDDFLLGDPKILVSDPDAHYTMCDLNSWTERRITGSAHDRLSTFYARLAEVLEANRDYLLDGKSRAMIADTEEDRRLVRVLALGAKMDAKTGRISGFDE